MAYLFQHFVYNFLRLERRDLIVRRENIAWSAFSATDPHLSLLPQMQTDVSIDNGKRRIVIDTKYYQETLSEYHGSRKIHPGNLYQLVSYMANIKAAGDLNVEGILVYPLAGEVLDQTYVVLGMPIRAVTIDLSQPWEKVAKQLMAIPN
jgi:5-methylcytosine-specific restriction enzyme subunit McrC